VSLSRPTEAPTPRAGPTTSPQSGARRLLTFPEYSEDIYPYATFQLKESVPASADSRCDSAAPLQTFVYHDPRLTSADTLQLREVTRSSPMSTGRRPLRSHPESPLQQTDPSTPPSTPNAIILIRMRPDTRSSTSLAHPFSRQRLSRLPADRNSLCLRSWHDNPVLAHVSCT
jgi:hypothetical protein